MTDSAASVIYLPGAGGYVRGPDGFAPELTLMKSGLADGARLEMIHYPTWTRYIGDDFSTDGFVGELAAEIAARVPQGSIHIIGFSLGGHFGYAVALRLQAMGRTVGGLCAIDSVMSPSIAPQEGWQRKAASEGGRLLQERRFREFFVFLRSKFWRAVIRLSFGSLRLVLRVFARAGVRSMSWLDPVMEQEISLRLLLQNVQPWLNALQRDPVALNAPASLLRTAEAGHDDVAWRRRCPAMDVHEIPGTHLSLFDAQYADALRRTLATATAGWSAQAGLGAAHRCMKP